MELFQLRSLLAVGKEGNVTRAADSLHLTQPAVTQQLRGLEREFGAKLVERTGRGVRLTAAGETLREHAQRALAILDEARRQVADLNAGETGHLTIGAGVTTSIFHLPQWLNDFKRSHPAVDVVVRTGPSRQIATLTLDREIDLGLVTSATSHPNLSVTPLFSEKIVLVAPPHHPLVGRSSTVADLSALPLILFPRGSGFRQYLEQALAAAGLSADVKMETDSVEAIKGFVAAGLGGSLLPRSAVDAEIADGSLAHVRVKRLPALTRTTAVIYRKDRYLTSAARAFLRVMSPR